MHPGNPIEIVGNARFNFGKMFTKQSHPLIIQTDVCTSVERLHQTAKPVLSNQPGRFNARQPSPGFQQAATSLQQFVRLVIRQVMQYTATDDNVNRSAEFSTILLQKLKHRAANERPSAASPCFQNIVSIWIKAKVAAATGHRFHECSGATTNIQHNPGFGQPVVIVKEVGSRLPASQQSLYGRVNPRRGKCGIQTTSFSATEIPPCNVQWLPAHQLLSSFHCCTVFWCRLRDWNPPKQIAS